MLFVLTIPPDFSRKLLRGERPALLIEADATDPMATGLAIGCLLYTSELAHISQIDRFFTDAHPQEPLAQVLLDAGVRCEVAAAPNAAKVPA